MRLASTPYIDRNIWTGKVTPANHTGGEYLVCLIRFPGGGIPSYYISSKKNSVIPIGDTERVAQYLDLLEKYNKE